MKIRIPRLRAHRNGPGVSLAAATIVAALLHPGMTVPALAQVRTHAVEGVFALPAKPKSAADPGVADPAAGSAAAAASSSSTGPARGDPTHVSREGGLERSLWLDSGRIAEFSDDGAPAIRAATPGELDAIRGGTDAAAGGLKSRQQASRPPAAGATAAPGKSLSPVFRDASGRPSALPGGVIVSLRQPLPDDEARAALEAAGLVPIRRIGERMWLVDSPAGIAALELANRLQEDGRFGFAQPNWWQPKATK